MNDSNSLIDSQLDARFGQQRWIIGTAQIEFSPEASFLGPLQRWGLLFVSGGMEKSLVFLHFAQDNWFSSLQNRRADEKPDLALTAPLQRLKIIEIKKKGLFASLGWGKMGSIDIEAEDVLFRSYLGERMVEEHVRRGSIRMGIDLDDVRAAEAILLSHLPQ